MDSAAIWDVWRRLPGTQGKNDCWSRTQVEAETGEQAIHAAAEVMADHMLYTDFFATPSDAATAVYFIREHREPATRTLEVTRADA